MNTSTIPGFGFITEKLHLAEIREKNYASIPEDAFYKIIRADPTYTKELAAEDFGGQFFRFLLDRYKADPDSFNADAWSMALQLWLKLKKAKAIPANEDLMKYKALDPLLEYMKEREAASRVVDLASYDVIYKSSDMILVHQKNQEASEAFGFHFEGAQPWCTAWPGGSFYAKYAKKGILAIAIKGPNDKGQLFSYAGVKTKDKAQFYVQFDNQEMEVEAYGKVQKKLEWWESYLGEEAKAAWLKWLEANGIEYDKMQYKVGGYVPWHRDLETGETLPGAPFRDDDSEDEEYAEGGDEGNIGDYVETDLQTFGSGEATFTFGYGTATTYENAEPNVMVDGRDALDAFGNINDPEAYYPQVAQWIFEELGAEVLAELDISPFGIGLFVPGSNQAFMEFLRRANDADQDHREFVFGDGNKILWVIQADLAGDQNLATLAERDEGFLYESGLTNSKLIGGNLYLWSDLDSEIVGAAKALVSGETFEDDLQAYLEKCAYFPRLEDETVDEYYARFKNSARFEFRLEDPRLSFFIGGQRFWSNRGDLTHYTGEDAERRLRSMLSSTILPYSHVIQESPAITFFTFEELPRAVGELAASCPDSLKSLVQDIIAGFDSGALDAYLALGCRRHGLARLFQKLNSLLLARGIMSARPTSFSGTGERLDTILIADSREYVKQKAASYLELANAEAAKLQEHWDDPYFFQQERHGLASDFLGAVGAYMEVYGVYAYIFDHYEILPEGPAKDFILHQRAAAGK